MSLVGVLARSARCQSAPEVPCTHGYIEVAFNHADAALPNWRAMHMALIPKGGAALPPPYSGSLRRGTVLIYDEGPEDPNDPPCGAQPFTPWAIFDPNATGTMPRWLDFTQPGNMLTHPPGKGNLACSGHTWTADGRLAIFAGNEQHSATCIDGATHVYLFDPTQGTIGNPPNVTWVRQNQSLLPTKRWYPAVVLAIVATGEGLKTRVLVIGGDLASRYIAWEPPPTPLSQAGRWEGGGTGIEHAGPSGILLGVYPYTHLLSHGKVTVHRFGDLTQAPAQTTTLLHPGNGSPGTWADLTDTNPNRLRARHWGCSLLFPNLDANHHNALVVFGGQSPTQPATADIQMCRPQRGTGCWPSGYYWTDLQVQTCTPPNAMPAMSVARAGANAVILPDGSFLAIGGGGAPAGGAFTNSIERYDGGQWHACASLVSLVPGSEYGYGFHSTAVLLPDGRVLIGAGNDTAGPRYDFQIYVPWYIACGGIRPKILSVNAGIEQVGYGQTFRVDYQVESGVTVDKVVLVRPSSVTHGNNSDQRYIELEIDTESELPPGQILAKMPAHPPGQGTTPSNPNEVTGPPGYYMVFLVSSSRIPSEAGWVQLVLP